MKTSLIICIITTILFSAVSCKRLDEDPDVGANALTVAESKVSDDFTWSTAHRVMLNVNLVQPANCSFYGPKNPTVYILDSDYNRIKAGVSNNNAIGFDVTLPKVMREVIIYLPESGAMKTVQVNGGSNSSSIEIPCISANKTRHKDGGATEPVCTSGCDRSITGNVASLSIGKKEVVCLTGNLNGPVEFESGGVLKICGNATLTQITLKKDGEAHKGIQIMVSETGTLTVNNTLTLEGKDDQLINYGEVTINRLVLNKSSLAENHKNFKVTDLTTNSLGEFNNTGTLTVGALSNNGKFKNTSSVVISGNLFTNSPPADFTNECMIKVTGDLMVNGKFTNSALISASTATLNGNSNFNMVNGAMLSLKNLNWNGTNVKTTGATSMFKISGSTTIQTKSKVTGSLDICDANGIESNAVEFKDNVKFCQSFIPKNECNDVGHGSPSIVDSDGDGVPDDSDDYPNDPTRAFDSYYPHAGYAINGYEDLWPSIGDYDFNDLVIKYKTHFVQNASNKYVTADFEVLLHAIGAGLHNGLGVQFVERGSGAEKYKRISTALVTGVSGQAEKVEGTNMVKVYNDVYEELTSYYNNVGDGPTKKPDTLRFKTTFTTGPAHPSALIPDFYIFRSDDRGHEIHLPDHPATALANPAMWGTFADNTQPTSYRWYKTTDNRPWGVEIINGTNTWKHPLSKIMISDAYAEFMPWVNSNGETHNDWYDSPDESKVFQGW